MLLGKYHHAVQCNKRLMSKGDRISINLASDEYYKSVKESQLDAQIVKPIFLDNKIGKYKVVSFYAKKPVV